MYVLLGQPGGLECVYCWAVSLVAKSAFSAVHLNAALCLLLSTGIHMVCRSGSKLSYNIYNLSLAKMEQESAFPTDTLAFTGQDKRPVVLHNAGEVC